jgi:hypothetical protein
VKQCMLATFYMSKRIINGEAVHVGNILYEQEDYVQEIVSCHKNNNDNLQTELSNETTGKLFDQQKDNLDIHIVDFIFENVKEDLDVFIDKPVDLIFLEVEPEHSQSCLKDEDMEKPNAIYFENEAESGMIILHVFKDPLANLLQYSKEMTFHDFQDSMVNLLQSSNKTLFVFSTKHGFDFYFESPINNLLMILLKLSQKAQILDQLINLLHWHFCIT